MRHLILSLPQALVCAVGLAFLFPAFASSVSPAVSPSAGVASLQVRDIALKQFVEDNVRDDFPYAGLASFYNSVSYYLVDSDAVETIPADQLITLNDKQWLAVVGHYKVLVLRPSSHGGLQIKHDGDTLVVVKAASASLNAYLAVKSQLKDISPQLDKLRYAHLWAPFRYLSLGIAVILLGFHGLHPWGWGVTIILFALLFKIFTLPINMLLISSQRKISYIQAKITPELEDIKANYKGQEAHEKFMATHKKHGVSPFYTLRSLFFVLLPLPFLISIFNVLGETDQIVGHSFLWIADLTHIDAIYHFDFHIPLLGQSINLLPILMTVFTLVAAVFHHNKIVAKKALAKQKANLYFMALAFFVLFYPFPSSMVLYWASANGFHLIQQKFLKI